MDRIVCSSGVHTLFPDVPWLAVRHLYAADQACRRTHQGLGQGPQIFGGHAEVIQQIVDVAGILIQVSDSIR